MKKFLLFMLTLATLIGAGPSPVDTQYLEGEQLLYNAGFENGLVKWANSGSGTLAKTTTAANVGSGLTAASWDAAANLDTVTSAQVAVPAGLYGKQCEGLVYYKGGDSNLTLKVIDGSVATLASVALSTSSNYTQSTVLSFACPTSGTMALQVAASANAAIIYLDKAYLGASLQVRDSSGNVIARNGKEIRFKETTANGQNYVGLKAPASVGSDLTFTLPSADGSNTNALTTNGSGTLGFSSIVVDPTSNRGEIIVRGAASLGALQGKTNNRVLRGDGTDLVSGQIDDTGFFTSGAAATPSAWGLAKGYALDQTAWKTRKTADYTITDTDGFLLITVANGVSNVTITLPAIANNAGRPLIIKKVDTGAGVVTVSRAGSDLIGYDQVTSFALRSFDDTLGLIEAEGYWSYLQGSPKVTYSYTETFSWNGSGGASSTTTTVKMNRNGQTVALFIGAAQATSRTSSTQFTSTTGLPVEYRPSGNAAHAFPGTNAGGTVVLGKVRIDTDGSMFIVKADGSAYANTTANSGFNDNTVLAFPIR